MSENTAQRTTESQEDAILQSIHDDTEVVAAPHEVTVTPDVTATEETGPKKKFTLKRWHKIGIGVSLVVVLLLVVAGSIGFYTYQVLQTMKVQAAELELSGRTAYASFKEQNLPAVVTQLDTVDQQLQTVTTTYNKLSFYRHIPIANTYYADGEHALAAGAAGVAAAKKSTAAIEPYADVLGFTGAGTFEGGTAENRLKLLLQTLQKVTPELDAITADLQTIEAELAQINPEQYPESLNGTPVRAQIEQVQTLSTGAVTALTEFRPVLEQLPSVAGATGERRQYLILFQNDNELRPTGGFLTAYAIINVEDGKVFPEKSDDIYELDKKYRTTEQIPEKLGRYLTTESRFNLRDMNISPDFQESMDMFYTEYVDLPGEAENIDGIIAVDTEFLKKLVTILGPVEVPGYGTFTAENDPRCDCPQIIYALSEIITRPTPYLREDRKGILGPLMRELLTKAYTAPKQQWPNLFQETFASVQGRHIQMYFLDEQAQMAAETINAAGRMKPPEDGSDFLAIVDANLGGAKSNLFIDYEVTQVVSAPENGMVEKTVEITYQNHRKGDNCNLEAGLLCLNSTLRDWNRLYVPAGTELVSAQGYNEEPQVYEENGFTVIDGFFLLEPLGTAKLKLTYKVPYEDTENYRLKIWKQGGIEQIETLMDVTGGQEQLTVVKDAQFSAPF